LAPDLCGTPIGDALNSGKYLQDGDVEIEAWGAYAEATYHFSERLSLIAGLRYNFEERDGTGSFVFDGAGININTDSSEDWDDWTPRVTVQFNLNEYIMLYGTYTEAFKSGVINTGSLSPPLDPETVDAWEFGIKGAAGSSSINYSLAVFHYDYEDLQISFVDETSVVSTINAAEAENYGVELELDAELGNGFSLDFYATYLSAEYEEFFNGDYANGFALTDLSGNTLPNAPENTLKLGINYENEFGGVAIRARGEVYYQDEVYFTEWNRSDAYQDSYELYNASIDVLFADSAWMLTLWGRNLGDEEVYSNNIITAPLYNSLRVGSTLPPRTYGATVGFEF
jgi:iron complex outermembrane receptor protein